MPCALLEDMATFTYRQLEAWRQAMNLVEACYLATSGFPREETYGLASQLRRAAVSIPSNIAEGHCRRTTAAYANHVSIALGSHGELATCLELALRLGFLSAARFRVVEPQADAVGRLLYGLFASLERKLEDRRTAARR